MKLKIVAGIIGVALLLAYVAPVVLRLKDVALSIVALVGIGMMLVDLWQSLQSRED